jgi:hypothetical protein
LAGTFDGRRPPLGAILVMLLAVMTVAVTYLYY